MEWMTLAATTAFVGLVLLVPGLLISTIGLRMSGSRAVSVAPAVSLAVIAFATLITRPLGISWGLLPIALMTAAVLLAVTGLRSLWPTSFTRESSWRAPADLATYAGLVIAALTISVAIALMIGTPLAISQTWDNITHLTLARYIFESGDPFPMIPRELLPGTGAYVIYPTVWHSLVALPMVSPLVPIEIASNAVMAAVSGFLWPASCIYFVRTAISARPEVLVASGALAASFPGFPYLLMDVGALFPTMTAYAAGGVVLGSLAQVAGLTRISSKGYVRPLTIAALSTAAVTLTHPRVTIGALTIVAPIVFAAVFRAYRLTDARERRESLRGWSIVLAIFLIAAPSAWIMAMVRPHGWSEYMGVGEATRAVLSGASTHAGSPWLIVPLLAIGVVAAIRTGALRWILVSFAIIAVIWVVTTVIGGQSTVRWLLASPFNEMSPRISALLPLLYVPIAALGLERLVGYFGDLQSPPGRHARASSGSLLPTAGICIALVLGVFLTPGAVPSAIWRGSVAYSYHDGSCEYPKSSSCLLSYDEDLLLRTLGEHVGTGDVIATNPWNGSGLAYALHGWQTTWPAGSFARNWNGVGLTSTLSRGPAETTCEVVRGLSVRFALDFGEQYVHTTFERQYPGLRGFENHPEWFTLTAQVGEARLYSIDMCWDE